MTLLTLWNVDDWVGVEEALYRCVYVFCQGKVEIFWGRPYAFWDFVCSVRCGYPSVKFKLI